MVLVEIILLHMQGKSSQIRECVTSEPMCILTLAAEYDIVC